MLQFHQVSKNYLKIKFKLNQIKKIIFQRYILALLFFSVWEPYLYMDYINSSQASRIFELS